MDLDAETFIDTNLGRLPYVLYDTRGAKTAVLWAGSWHSDNHGSRGSPIALSLASVLNQDYAISSLLLGYRHNHDLWNCVQDIESGVTFLETLGIQRIALVGHSFSGAAVISAAPLNRNITAVAALAAQTYGAQRAADVAPPVHTWLEGWP